MSEEEEEEEKETRSRRLDRMVRGRGRGGVWERYDERLEYE